jgi:hypothetical protein
MFKGNQKKQAAAAAKPKVDEVKSKPASEEKKAEHSHAVGAVSTENIQIPQQTAPQSPPPLVEEKEKEKPTTSKKAPVVKEKKRIRDGVSGGFIEVDAD